MGRPQKNMITLPLGDGQSDREFCREYENLYHRLCRLADSLAGYFLVGTINVVVAASASREGAPRFIAATFDATAAALFELRAQRVRTRPYTIRDLPKPGFPVTLEVQFADGGSETFAFNFKTYSDQTVEEFCGKICESARRRYRFRFVRRQNG